MEPKEHEQYRDLAFVESFSAWLDETNDSLPEAQSFSEWLSRNNDAVKKEDQ